MFRRMIVVGAIAMFAAPIVRAQHSHDGGPPHDHGTPLAFVTPTTYRQAVEQIDARLSGIADLMKAGELAKVHAQAEVIQKVGRLVGQLALKDGSGVPKEAAKDVNLAGKALADKFDAIDKAGDAGDAAGTKKVYDEMVPLLAALRKHAPVLYHCPMGCEGEKTYTEAVKCPACGMALVDTRAHKDHEARHGGVFFMAADQFHHLEGTLSAEGEFRIYFYDDFTKPISAEKFTAEGKAWPTGAPEDQRKAVAIAVAPSKKYLTGKINASIKFPASLKVYVDFKNGQKAQVFDFDFPVASKEPKAEEHGKSGKG